MNRNKTKKYNRYNKQFNQKKTRKCKPTSSELKKLCSHSPNTFNQFEDKYETKFKGNLFNRSTNIQKDLIKQFKTPFTPSKYKINDDYYTYINYQWIKKTSKQIENVSKYYVQVDNFRVVQEKVYYELIDLVENYIKNNNTSRSRALQNVYNSFLNLDETAAENAVHAVVSYIDLLIEQNNFYKLIAELNRNEIVSWGSPIVWNVLPDEKNSKIYKSTISSPQLTIYDYTIYIDEPNPDPEKEAYKQLFKRKYLQFIEKMFDNCLGHNHGLLATDVWNVEYDILTQLGCNTIKKDSPDFYNIVSSNEALTKYNFDWSTFSKYLGYKKPPNTFICSSLNYLKCIMDLLQTNDTWKSPKWRTYYIYINLRQIMRFHNKWFYDYYEFHGKFIRGRTSPWPREIYPIFGLSLCFNTLITNEYIEHNKKQQTINYVHNMATDLLTVFKRIIKRNKWLSPSTKKYALLKLQHINLIVGSPKILREDPILNYDNKGAYQNLIRIARWRANRLVKLEGKQRVDIPIIDWEELKLIGTQAYVVNAYYTPTENSIYVPLAYLQKPFIDLDERGIEYNLAHIGYTLAHEMSHCLDDMGSKYDYKGNLHNWWTKADRHKFNLKVKDVAKQYETFSGYDNIPMDATLSTGENLADISGLAICVEYLRDFQDYNDDIVLIRALSFHAFFTYIAVQGRQKIFDAAIKAQLKMNPHPMDKYRVNCPLSRLQLFRSLYNIKKGDKMYWPSTDTIW